jgi:hypothetical protein
MLHWLNRKLLENNHEWWSKIADGLAAAGLITLLWFTVTLVIRPIQNQLGQPGLLVYGLGLLAISMFSLQQSLVPRRGETSRAWFGIAGGLLAWSVARVTAEMGVPILPSLAGVIQLMMAGLIVFLLWRSVLPLGARFFSLTFLLSWSAYIFLAIHTYLAQLAPFFAVLLRVLGVAAGFLTLLLVAWILFQTRRRIQRISGALAVWFLITVMVEIFGWPGF